MEITTTVIVLIVLSGIVNWIILYLIIRAATKSKSNMVYFKAQFELLQQIALKSGVDEETVNDIDTTKNRMLLKDTTNLDEWEKFRKKVKSEPVYFVNTLEQVYIRSEPSIGFWIKIPGEPEHKAKPGSTIVSAGILEHKEIKKKKYESGKW